MRALLVAVVVGLALVGVVGSAGPASAHAHVVSMSPEVGATVRHAPSYVVLRFDENVRAPSRVEVVGPDGSRVDRGAASVLDDQVRVRVVVERPGTYAVAYRVLSADGHPVEGAESFNFLRPGTSPDGATPASSAQRTGGQGAVLVAAGAAVLLGLVLLGVARAGSRRGRRPTVRRRLPVLVGAAMLVGAGVLVTALVLGGGVAQPGGPTLGADAFSGWALPGVRLVADLAGVACLGGLVCLGWLLTHEGHPDGGHPSGGPPGAPVGPVVETGVGASGGSRVDAGVAAGLGPGGHPLARLVGGAGVLWAAAVLVETVVTAVDISGRSLAATLSDAGPVGLVTASAQARALGVQLLLVVALAGLVLAGVGARRARAVAVLAALAWVPPLLTGHVAGSGSHLLAAPSLVAHVLAGAAWVGGLAAVTVLVAGRGAGSGGTAVTVARFSTLAGWCFVVVAASGVLNAGVRLGGPAALVESGYGRLVLAKVAALLVLGGFGWWHRRRTVRPPTAGSCAAALRKRFAVVACAELVVMTATMALAVGLSRTPTPGAEAGPAATSRGVPSPGAPA